MHSKTIKVMFVPLFSLWYDSKYMYIYNTLAILFVAVHYENKSMQYTEIFIVVKMKIFSRKCLIFFLFLLKT